MIPMKEPEGFQAALAKKYTVAQLNGCTQEDFARVIGPVFEHSPWIAAATWAARPFADLEALHRALCGTVQKSTEPERLALIRAHPDLVDRAALAGGLTPQSTAEQASAGLNRLTPAEIARFQVLNQDYRDRFGFPFVICARLNDKAAIVEAFRARLQHSREQEIQTALEEISKIAYLRLKDIVRAP